MFKDRVDAGVQLANALGHFAGSGAVVLALPRGGIVLGAEMAKKLQAPLGLVLVRKIGHPDHAEYAIGAVAENEAPLYNETELAAVDKTWLKQAEAEARDLITRRRKLYYGNDFTPPQVKGETVILVDDGIATGLTMKAAVQATRSAQAGRIIVAVPVASSESVAALKTMADDVIVLDNPEHFLGAVGSHYKKFDQVDDEQVKTLLRGAIGGEKIA